MTGGITPSPPSDTIIEQTALWWHEIDSALQSGQLVRARRFLRWILACCPEDVEAWLWIARLTPRLEERLALLRRAYELHPDSVRLRLAMRRAREEQLAEAVGELKPWQARVRCLPDDRRIHSENGKDRNGSLQRLHSTYAKALRLRFRLGRETVDAPAKESSS
jgi:hypothetical protein